MHAEKNVKKKKKKNMLSYARHIHTDAKLKKYDKYVSAVMSVRTVFKNITIRSKNLNISFSEFFERLFCIAHTDEILNTAEARNKSLAFRKLSENTKCRVCCVLI
jgi:hypothetical protein